MSRTVGDFILERLGTWGVERVFGYPGDGINGITSAFGRQDKIEFIQTRHEEEAAFMASGHAKLTGDVGVCLATSGPGAIHLLNGLYDAKLDRKPVVAIIGQSVRQAIGGHFQQEVDLLSLSRTWRATSFRCLPCRNRHAICWTAPFASPRRSAA